LLGFCVRISPTEEKSFCDMTFYLSECVAAYFGRFYIAQIHTEALRQRMGRVVSKEKSYSSRKLLSAGRGGFPSLKSKRR